MIQRVSQSFVKDFQSYIDGEECGIIINAKYIDDRLLDDPNQQPGAKELGSYFEFITFGNLPKSGIAPTPVMLANGKDMAAEYRLAHVNSKRVLALFDELGLEIIERGKKYTYGRFHGTIDLVCRCTKDVKFDTGVEWKEGDIIVIDVKYSGLIGETTPGWNKHGWRFTPAQKAYHGIQAVHYHMITHLPFYFFVVQSNNKEGSLSDMRFFHIPVTENMVETHKIKANDLFDRFFVRATAGDLKPRPSLMKCQKCPLREECKFRHFFPHPEIIDLNVA
jgi:hypothetical protein